MRTPVEAASARGTGKRKSLEITDAEAFDPVSKVTHDKKRREEGATYHFG